MKHFKAFVSLLFLFYPIFFNAQVLNIDRENGEDSLRKKIKASFTANFSNDKQRNNFIQFINTSELEWFFKNNYFLLLLNNSDFAD